MTGDTASELEHALAELGRLKAENGVLREQLAGGGVADWQKRLSEDGSQDSVEAVFHEFCELLGLDSASLYFFLQEKSLFDCQLSYPPSPEGGRQRLNHYITDFPWVAEVLSAGRPVNSAEPDESEAAATDRESFKAVHAGSYLLVPVMQQGRLFAFLALAVRHEGRSWADQEIALSKSVAKILYRYQRALEQSQRERFSAELLDAVLDVSGTGYWVWERGLGVVEFSHGSDLFPKGEEESTEAMFSFIHEADRSDARALFAQCLEQGGEKSGCHRTFVDADQRWHWYQSHFRAVTTNAQGQATRIICAFSDVTQFLDQQNLLEDAWSQANSANMAKSEFLARMSHEIRTPMNAVLGMAHLMAATDLTPRQQDYLEGISGSAQDLMRIINDILDFSKIEAGKLDIDEHDFHLDQLIDQMAAIFTVNNRDRGLELIYDIEDSLPRNLRGDGERLKQVLINLVSNAVKFTESGHVILRARQLEANDEQLMLQFQVIDTGIGMDAAQLDRLFQPFMQADGSTTRRYGGSGLGLSICKRLVELMGGEISVESSSGVGSVFTFYLPFRYGVLDRPVSQIKPEDLASMRALIVDDNPHAREIIARTVASLGLDVGEADNGKSAVNMVFDTREQPETHYDVIFMDYRMPELDGVTAAQLIKRQKDLPHCPTVIMVSAAERSDIGPEGSGAIDAFLHKPISRSRIFDTLAELFGRGEVQLVSTTSEAEGEFDMTFLDGLRVLLVEDNIVNQKVATGILSKQHVEITVANHGGEALEILDAAVPGHFDVVLMDMEMPEVDGFTATAEIRKMPDWRRIPIVAMTAHAIKGDRERCLNAGMDGYISKPISPQLLYRTLAEVLGQCP